MKKRRNNNRKDERRYPDPPDGLVYLAATNKPFAERFIGVFSLAKAGVKNGQR